MADESKPVPKPGSDAQEGAPPQRRKNRDRDIRKEGEADTGGDSPMDPADEDFIEKK